MEHVAVIIRAASVEMDRFTQVRKQYLEPFESDFRHGLEDGRRVARIDYPTLDGARVCRDSALNDNAIIFTAPMEVTLDRVMDADGVGTESAQIVHESESEDAASPSSGGACASTAQQQIASTAQHQCEIVCGRPLKRIRCKSTPIFK